MIDVTLHGLYSIIGPPGTGKTTTLGHQIARLFDTAHLYAPGRSLFMVCSLTRTAAAEVVAKAGQMSLNVDPKSIGTLHSHAYRAIGAPPVVNAAAIAQWCCDQPGYAISGAQTDPDNPEDGEGRATTTDGDDMHANYQNLRARLAPRDQWPHDVLRFAERWEAFKADHEVIDFGDMIDRARHETACALGNPNVLMADEFQDCSAAEIDLLMHWSKGAEATIIVGDPWQSLYAWRGADPDAMMPSRLNADHFKVLKHSYRVPAAVHSAAVKWVSQLTTTERIEYLPREGAEGSVRSIEASYRDPSAIIDDAIAQVAAGRSAMICGACSYMLDRATGELKDRGAPYSNPWRIKRGDWNPLGAVSGARMTPARRLVNFLAIDSQLHGDKARLWTWPELWSWAQLLASKGVIRHGMKAKIEHNAKHKHEDEVVRLSDLSDIFEQPIPTDLFQWMADREDGDADMSFVQRFFTERALSSKQNMIKYPLRLAAELGAASLVTPPRLHVGTIHSFKGAEADVVYVMPDLSPAGAREWDDGGRAGDSIVRMFYVALTRAREEVVLCDAGGRHAVDWLECGIRPQ